MPCHVRYIRALTLATAVSAGASGCVQVPADPTDEHGAVQDASLALDDWIDEGPVRPMTAEPYTGPDCFDNASRGATAPGPAGAMDGGAASPVIEAIDAAPELAGGETAGRARSPVRGELRVSEVMPNPVGVDDSAGEWVEVWNTSAVELALGGCALDDGGSTPREFASDLTLASDAYLVIARSERAGFAPDVVMSLSLGNGADSVAVWCGGVEIDRMRYGDELPVVAGASLSLGPDGRWCPARQSYGRDLGTPGQPNPPCDGAGAGEDAGS